jgi:hypothetical protein
MMDNSWIRELFPQHVENFSDDILNKVRSVIVKNTEIDNFGIGFTFRESDIDTDFVYSFMEALEISVKPNLKELVDRSLFTGKQGSVLVIGIPGPNIKGIDEMQMWINGDNVSMKTYFGVTNDDPNLRLTNVRFRYKPSEDRLLTRKEYYATAQSRTEFFNKVYELTSHNTGKLVYQQKCLHEFGSPSYFTDFDNLLEHLPAEQFKFQSYKRRDSAQTYLYITKKS